MISGLKTKLAGAAFLAIAVAGVSLWIDRLNSTIEDLEGTVAAQESTLEAFRRAEAAAAADADQTAAADDARVVIRERIVHAPPTDDAPAAPVLLDAVRRLWPPTTGPDNDGHYPAESAHLP